MYYTTTAPDPQPDPPNAALIESFRKAFPEKDDLSSYTLLGYDAGRLLIDAIGRAIDTAGGKMPTRRQVLEAVQNTKSFKGTVGTYSFDVKGDTTSPTMWFYQ